ncbi:MAG: NAD(P)H-dependent oxidoreductase [Bacteroidales bacterium]|nr:NAD(P)H-dependent oxidoreductase [Bacteroidales bacterium]
MKKLFTSAALVCIILCGCSQNKNQQAMKEDQNSAAVETQQQNGKALVTYFSASGVTKGVAERLAKIANADLVEIVPEKRYTSADLDWRDKNSRSSVEMKDLNSRPAIANHIDNIADYQTVYIGFPIWWYTAPTIINTFIEAHDLSGKNVVLFATSGGSTIDKAAKDLQEKYPEIHFVGSALLNSPSDEDLKAIVK